MARPGATGAQRRPAVTPLARTIARPSSTLTRVSSTLTQATAKTAAATAKTASATAKTASATAKPRSLMWTLSKGAWLSPHQRTHPPGLVRLPSRLPTASKLLQPGAIRSAVDRCQYRSPPSQARSDRGSPAPPVRRSSGPRSCIRGAKSDAFRQRPAGQPPPATGCRSSA